MAKLSLLLLCVFLVSQETLALKSVTGPLVKRLLSQSKSMLIPINKVGEKLTVFIGVGVQSIEKIDYEKNELTATMIVSKLWQTGMAWEPSRFNGLTRMSIPQYKMWTPDVAITNSVTSAPNFAPPNAMILSNGMAVVEEHFRTTITCDVSNDDSCQIHFMSNGFNNDFMVLEGLSKLDFDISGYLDMWANKGARFQATDGEISKIELRTDGLPEVFDILTYKFTAKDTHANYRHRPSSLIMKLW